MKHAAAAWLLAGGLVLAGIGWPRPGAAADTAPVAELDDRAWMALDAKATALYAQGRFDQAIAVTEEALRRAVTQFGVHHIRVAKYQHNLAQLYLVRHREAEAELLYQRSLEIAERAVGPDHPQVAQILDGYIAAETTLGHTPQAEALKARLAAIHAKEQSQQGVLDEFSNEAERLFQRKRYAESAAVAQEALTLAEQKFGPLHPEIATYLNDLATAYYAQGKDGEAQPLYRKALAILEQTAGPDHPTYATLLENYALSLRRTGDMKTAQVMETRAKELRAKKKRR